VTRAQSRPATGVVWAPAECPGGRVVLGLGATSRVREEDLDGAVDDALACAGLSSAEISVLATVDRRVLSAAVRAFAGRRGWILRAFPAAALAAQPVPNPSAVPAARIGTASVAEAAALLAAGENAELIVGKRVYPCVTVAIGRGVPAATLDK